MYRSTATGRSLAAVPRSPTCARNFEQRHRNGAAFRLMSAQRGREPSVPL